MLLRISRSEGTSGTRPIGGALANADALVHMAARVDASGPGLRASRSGLALSRGALDESLAMADAAIASGPGNIHAHLARAAR